MLFPEAANPSIAIVEGLDKVILLVYIVGKVAGLQGWLNFVTLRLCTLAYLTAFFSRAISVVFKLRHLPGFKFPNLIGPIRTRFKYLTW